MKEKIAIITMMIVLLSSVGFLAISLINGPKCISTEQKTVEVIIVDEYHRSSYMTPMSAGKVIIMHRHPAVYQITVKYNDTEYTIDEEDTYNRYKNKIGETTTGTLEIRTYEDGSVRYFIVSLE